MRNHGGTHICKFCKKVVKSTRKIPVCRGCQGLYEVDTLAIMTKTCEYSDPFGKMFFGRLPYVMRGK